MARIKVEDWLTDDGLLQIKEWAEQGYTDKEIYQAIHIGKTTFYKWVSQYPEIKEAIDLGRKPVILEVEKSFVASLTDRYVNETTIVENPNGEQTRTARRRFIPGKTGAQIFYLKNHYPEKYRERNDFEVERLKLELEKAKKDIELKDLQIKQMRQEIEEQNPEISKVDLLLKEFDDEAFKETE